MGEKDNDEDFQNVAEVSESRLDDHKTQKYCQRDRGGKGHQAVHIEKLDDKRKVYFSVVLSVFSYVSSVDAVDSEVASRSFHLLIGKTVMLRYRDGNRLDQESVVMRVGL